jgi:putative hydrolase of the HAD superfamily
MDSRFKDVRVLIWDFDGTLYRPNQNLWHAIREAEYRVIMEKNEWDHARAQEEFNKLYKKVTPSATQTVGRLTGMSTTEASLIMEKYYDRRDYVARDERLVQLFTSLSSFTHYILANGVRFRIEETLALLGVPKETFEEIVTSEISGENKPSDKGFLYIMKKTNLLPPAHLMIGDREKVDLEPAKKLGIKTCLIAWDGVTMEEGSNYDVTVAHVYDVATLSFIKGSA